MLKAPIPSNDYLRVQNLHELDILDTAPEDEFNEIVQLASAICNTPISLISLVDYSRQWFKAKVGVTDNQTPRDISFCGHAILVDHDFFEVRDALEDSRFFDNPLVLSEPHIRFYAGVQLVSRKGFKIGMLCVNDTVPGKLNKEQVQALKVLGNHVAKLIDLKVTRKISEEKTRKIEMQNEMQKKMISIIAHDIRGPIGNIKTALDMIDANLISEEAKHKLAAMFPKQISNTLDLLNNIVDWGNIQLNNSLKSGKENILLWNIVENELNNLKLGAELKQNKLCNLVNNTALININPNILKFILRNLLINSNKFTQNGKISVYHENAKSRHMIAVSDTGIGMSQENIKDLLSADKTLTTKGTLNEKGSGMGIRLIKEFIEEMGGTSLVESELGKGTTVRLLISE